MTGQTISHYEIIAPLGAGGMGVVYRARDIHLDREVALKFLAPNLAESSTARSRFLREAKVLSSLNHPHIATIFEAGECDGQLFLALELLPGGTLGERLADLRSAGKLLPLKEALQLAADILDGLAHAHRNGILHRDIKPANLMFSSEGALKITDFGLSKFTSSPDLTSPGGVLGTAMYMSPEQAMGEEIDHRADLFSAGVVLYEMLAGQPPFQGDNQASVLRQVIAKDPAPVGSSRAGLPSPVEAIVLRALMKEPARRYARAEEMSSDLQRIQLPDGLTATIETLPVSKPLAVSKPIPRWRAWAGGMLALTAVGAAAFFVGHRSAALPEQKQLAVLPFVNVGKSEAGQAFCDGIFETLTSSLSQLEQPQGSLFVVPASEVRKRSLSSPTEARQAFNANLAITGSVQQSGGQIRVIANLIDAREVRQLGSRQVVRSADQMAGLQEALVDQVADLLKVGLQPAARARVVAGKTESGSAYTLYLEGRGLLERWDKPGNLDRALSLMRRAVEQDPHYALAYAGYSQAAWRKYMVTKDAPWLQQALELGSRAIALDTQTPGAHINLAHVYFETGRSQEAIAEYRRAIGLDPLSAEAYRGLAEAYDATGGIPEAEETYRKALQLRPGDWLTYTYLGSFYSKHGRVAEAEKALARVTELTPDNFVGHRNLGSVHVQLEKYDAAAADYRKAIALSPLSATSYNGLAAVLFYQRRYAESAAIFEKAVQLKNNDQYFIVGNLADAYRQAPGQEWKAAAVYARAIAGAGQALAKNPKDSYALASRAEYWAKQGEPAQAVRDAEAAWQLAPRDTNILLKVAVAYEWSHRRAKALEAVSRALKEGTSAQQIAREPDLSGLMQDPMFKKIKADK